NVKKMERPQNGDAVQHPTFPNLTAHVSKAAISWRKRDPAPNLEPGTRVVIEPGTRSLKPHDRSPQESAVLGQEGEDRPAGAGDVHRAVLISPAASVPFPPPPRRPEPASAFASGLKPKI